MARRRISASRWENTGHLGGGGFGNNDRDWDPEAQTDNCTADSSYSGHAPVPDHAPSWMKTYKCQGQIGQISGTVPWKLLLCILHTWLKTHWRPVASRHGEKEWIEGEALDLEGGNVPSSHLDDDFIYWVYWVTCAWWQRARKRKRNNNVSTLLLWRINDANVRCML